MIARILDAAQTEFMRAGYERANTNSIVRRFRGSKATLFRHFPSKRQLLLAVVRRIAASWREQVPWYHIGAADPEPWLVEFGVLALRWILRDENIFVGRMAIAEHESFPELRAIFFALASSPIERVLAERLASWTSRGVLRCDDPGRDATCFFDLVLAGPVSRALYNVERGGRPTKLRAHVVHAVRLYLYGLRSSSRARHNARPDRLNPSHRPA